jgi:phytoene synthase
MSETLPDAPLASFETKWTQARPELGLALKFVTEHERAAQGAFACLVCELEHAAFGIREAQPAAIKLQWWGEEFARAGRSEARHPLTQALQSWPGFTAIPLTQWYEVISGAFEQRDPQPAATGAILLDHYARLYGPLGAIEATLFGANATATSGALTVARVLRETTALPQTLQNGRLPLPMDVLARHRLSRGDLMAVSAARNEALREWLLKLAAEQLGLVALARLPASAEPGAAGRGSTPQLSALRSAMSAADGKRVIRAAHQQDPLAALTLALDRLSFRAVWAAWRAARRSR